MTHWEECVIRRYGSLKNYVFDQLASEGYNAIKTRFDKFYREMEMSAQEGKDRTEASLLIVECYDIQPDTVDDYVLDAVLYSF